MKCSSIWPCSRLLRCAKANIDQPQHLRRAVQEFSLYYLYLCVCVCNERLRCIQYGLVSLTLHSLGLITLPFASTGALTSHSVLPIRIFGFQGHCLHFALAWQIQFKLVSIKQHGRTWTRLKMDFLWCYINWKGCGVYVCVCAFDLEIFTGSLRSAQTNLRWNWNCCFAKP